MVLDGQHFIKNLDMISRIFFTYRYMHGSLEYPAKMGKIWVPLVFYFQKNFSACRGLMFPEQIVELPATWDKQLHVLVKQKSHLHKMNMMQSKKQIFN